MNLTKEQIIKLLQVKGVGRNKVLKFCDLLQFSPATDYELVDALLERLPQLKIQPLSANEVKESFEKAENLIENSNELGIKIFVYSDSDYPPLLRKTPNYPIILYVKGDYETLINNPTVAVIGTREPSNYGKSIGERIGYRLGEKNINVISGLAKGCDTSAHIGCLKAKGITSAVLAHGLDSIYPRENKVLAEKIVESGGCLISEYIVKTRALGNFFIERDRIQAGLSKATVVVETDIKGGTMHTVNFTTDYDRILAVFDHPEEYQTEKSRGNQFLIKEKGARSLQTKDDIDELIELVNPSVKWVFSGKRIPIADINTRLFYDEGEWNALITPKEKEKKPRKPRKPKSNVLQLRIEGDVPPPPKKRKKKEKGDIAENKPDDENNI